MRCPAGTRPSPCSAGFTRKDLHSQDQGHPSFPLQSRPPSSQRKTTPELAALPEAGGEPAGLAPLLPQQRWQTHCRGLPAATHVREVTNDSSERARNPRKGGCVLTPVPAHPVRSVTGRWLSCPPPPAAGHCQPVSALGALLLCPQRGQILLRGWAEFPRAHTQTRHHAPSSGGRWHAKTESGALTWWAQPGKSAQRASGNQARRWGCHGKSLVTPSEGQAPC